MNRTDQEHIIPLQELFSIPAQENDDPLVVLQDYCPAISCAYEKMDMVPITGESMYVRKTVADMINRAQEQLSQQIPGAQFHLVYAYRHPDVQNKYFEQRKTELKKHHPELTDLDLESQAHLLSAHPEVGGHSVGAAIDATIVLNGQRLDMGTGIADFEDTEKIKTFSDNLTKEQHDNRMLLRNLLVDVGFCPFDGEWWHFSYGDREWAAYYDKPAAIYSAILL